MSTAGVFKLLTNVGKQDDYLMRTDLLTERIKYIEERRLETLRSQYPNLTDGELKRKPEPIGWTLNEIKKTHELFTYTSFKPFVATGYEYSKTSPNDSDATFGRTATIVIPQHGQFINDLVVRLTISGLAATSALDKVRWC